MSRPHPSFFETSSGSFELPGHLSEWLFVLGFWKKVADASEIRLDQYEDEEVSSEAIVNVTLLLDELVSDLREVGVPQERFTYAWTQSGKPIEAQVGTEEALTALKGLRLFLHEAHEGGREVVFSL